MTLKSTLMLATAALMASAGIANATVYTYTSNQTGHWKVNSTWTSSPPGGTYPVAGDTAIINGHTVTVDIDEAGNAAALDLQISNSGVLQVESGKALTIQSGTFNSSAVTHQINGDLVLETGKLELDDGFINIVAGGRFIMQGTTPEFQVDVPGGMLLPSSTSRFEVLTTGTILGSGSVQGGDPDASVVINVDGGSAVTLTLSGAMIEGELTILAEPGDGGSGSFVNAGMVKANEAESRILLDNSLSSITDSGNQCDANWWAVSDCELRFGRSATLGTAFENYGSVFVNPTFAVTTSGRKLGGGSDTRITYGSPVCP